MKRQFNRNPSLDGRSGIRASLKRIGAFKRALAVEWKNGGIQKRLYRDLAVRPRK